MGMPQNRSGEVMSQTYLQALNGTAQCVTHKARTSPIPLLLFVRESEMFENR
jgi:hypothetical protein